MIGEENPKEQEPIPVPSAEEVIRCQFHSWYSIPELRQKSLKSKIVNLDHDFLDYLASDGIILPKCADDDRPTTVFLPLGGNDEISDFDYNITGEAPNWDESVPSDDANRPNFPNFDNELRSIISELGGSVFIKTNWSAPIDAAWINTSTLKCQRTADIYLLLKSSDRTTFDLEHMMLASNATAGAGDDTDTGTNESTQTQTIQRPEESKLILRKWININPSMEFRVYILKGKLVGICQRDVTTCYDFLIDCNGNDVLRFKDLLIDWLYPSIDDENDENDENGENMSESELWITKLLNIRNYSLDLYIDRNRNDKVYLIDVNVYGYPSDPLLYDWSELEENYNNNNGIEWIDSPLFQLRTITSRSHTKASAVTLGQQEGPIDVSLAPDFSRFMEICQQQQQQDENDSSSSSD